MPEESVGCARPTGAVVGASSKEDRKVPQESSGGDIVQARVGGKAPDFTAPAFHKGKFVQVKLSDHLGRWVLLCFYPGDFTFV